MLKPEVFPFFDENTNTFTYVVKDPESQNCAVIDSVLDFDASSGKINTSSADRVCEFIEESGLSVEWVIETHVHADHLSAAPLVKQRKGGKMAIGSRIIEVQNIFGKVFNAGTDFMRDGSQFDVLFEDGESFTIGNLACYALHTPGHTPACMTYNIGGVLFVGDTLFMPDFGSARCDFPGGSASELYKSVQRIFSYPDDTAMYMCHDYKTEGRSEYKCLTSVGEQKKKNVHFSGGVSEAEFIGMRESRDAKLSMPKLILPSVQVNMRGGNMPPAEDNGKSYLKIPLERD